MSRRSLGIIAVTLSGLAYWGLVGQGGFTPRSSDTQDWAPPAPMHTRGVRLAVLATGQNRGPEAFIRRSGSLFRMRSSVASAVLVVHPKGDVLIDAGLGRQHQRHVSGPGGIPLWARPSFTFSDLRPAADLLAERAAAIHGILLTHMHFDHAGGIEDFPQAQIWLPHEELKQAREKAFGFVHAQYDAPGIRWQPYAIENRPYANFARSHDVYGDGAIVSVPLPGHTRGSTGVFVTLSSGRRYLFVGDLVWTLEALEKPEEKPVPATLLVDTDAAEIRGSMEMVRRVQRAMPALQVVPAHDAKVLSQLPAYPRFAE